MTKKSSRRSRGRMPDELRRRWRKSLAEFDAERPPLDARARAVFLAHDASRAVIARLKAERQRQGLGLADILERTGISRAALSRLENDDAPNPTVRTLARYAAAVGLELQVVATARRGRG